MQRGTNIRSLNISFVETLNIRKGGEESHAGETAWVGTPQRKKPLTKSVSQSWEKSCHKTRPDLKIIKSSWRNILKTSYSYGYRLQCCLQRRWKASWRRRTYEHGLFLDHLRGPQSWANFVQLGHLCVIPLTAWSAVVDPGWNGLGWIGPFWL